jgi:hypothetical protein
VRGVLRLLPLLAALVSCAPIPLVLPPPPSLTPAEDRALRSTLSAATSTNTSTSIPDRLCPEHQARAAPGEKCRDLPCGGQCRSDQACDEAAIVPRCVAKPDVIAGPNSR